MTISPEILSEGEAAAARDKLRPLLDIFATDDQKIAYLMERVIALEAIVLKLAKRLAEHDESTVELLRQG